MCLAGTEYVYSGSKIDTLGTVHAAPVPNFWFVAISDITALGSISEPVAAKVRTENIGRASFISFLSTTKSHGSLSYLTPAAMTLAQSIDEPPPTASTPPRSCCLQSFIPSLTDSILGFGSTSASSTHSILFFINSSVTSLYMPFFLIDPPP